jgi:hypothetical protein
MEPIRESKEISQELQQNEAINPNPNHWDSFYKKFTPLEKKMFLSNQMHFFTSMIQKDLRKMKENLRKLRENDR